MDLTRLTSRWTQLNLSLGHTQLGLRWALNDSTRGVFDLIQAILGSTLLEQQTLERLVE